MFKKIKKEHYIYALVLLVFLLEFIWIAKIDLVLNFDQFFSDLFYYFLIYSIPLATFIGIYIAAKTIRDWRREHFGKHKFKVAQDSQYIITKVIGVLGVARRMPVMLHSKENQMLNYPLAAQEVVKLLWERRETFFEFEECKTRFNLVFRQYGKRYFAELHDIKMELSGRALELITHWDSLQLYNSIPPEKQGEPPNTILANDRFEENMKFLFLSGENDLIQQRMIEIGQEAIEFLDQFCKFK